MSKQVNRAITIIGVLVILLVISNVAWYKTARNIKETVNSNAVEMTELRNTFVGLKERIESDKEFEKEYNTFISELQEKRDNIDKKYGKLDSVEETKEYINEIDGLKEDYLNWCREKAIIE